MMLLTSTFLCCHYVEICHVIHGQALSMVCTAEHTFDPPPSSIVVVVVIVVVIIK